MCAAWRHIIKYYTYVIRAPRFMYTPASEGALKFFFNFFFIFSSHYYVLCCICETVTMNQKIMRKTHLVNLEWTHSHSSTSKWPKGCILFHFSCAAVCSFVIFYYRSLFVYLEKFVALFCFFWYYYLVFFVYLFIFNSAVAGAA